MTTEIAVQAKTDLVIAPDQTTFTEVQLSALKQLGVDNAPAGDIAVFFHQAKRTGLDPFAKQIYMIGRNTKVGDGYEMRYTIQTGIDGYRLNARRAADRNNDRLATEGPYWRGESGEWDDVWLDKSNPPAAAKFTVIRNGEAFTGIAMFHEYVQTYFDRQRKEHVPNSMWLKMPANQLAKCAEAAAWRRAYPDDFSGIVLEDAAQVIDESGVTVVRSERGGRGVAALREKAAAAQVVDAEPDPEPAPASTGDMSAQTRRKWLNRMFQLLGQFQVDDADQLIVIAALAGLPVNPVQIEHRDQITDDQLRQVVKTLDGWEKDGSADAELRELLNAASLAADNQTETN